MAKLLRKTALPFGDQSGPNQSAQFGSLANGTPNFSLDPAIIQALANWRQGWPAAVMGGNSPAIEDMNSAFLVFAYQLAYLMQEGVAEYDVGTTYFKGSIVLSGFQLFQSQADNNTGNPITNPVFWLPLLSTGAGYDVKRWWAYNFDTQPGIRPVGCPGLTLTGSGGQSLQPLPGGTNGNGLILQISPAVNSWAELDATGPHFHVHRFGDEYYLNFAITSGGGFTIGMMDASIAGNPFNMGLNNQNGYMMQLNPASIPTVGVNNGSAGPVIVALGTAPTPINTPVQYKISVTPTGITFTALQVGGYGPFSVTIPTQNPAEGVILQPVINFSQLSGLAPFQGQLYDLMMRFNPFPS